MEILDQADPRNDREAIPSPLRWISKGRRCRSAQPEDSIPPAKTVDCMSLRPQPWFPGTSERTVCRT